MQQRVLIAFILCLAWTATATAQSNFSSGSTGADGAFAPTSSQTITVPASGVFNYTTVSIPTGVTITYLRNSANTPLTILATSDVNIIGSLVLDGQQGSGSGFGGLGGPGGFTGGGGGLNAGAGSIADGPGGGRGGPLSTDQQVCGGGSGGGYQIAGSAGGAITTSCNASLTVSAAPGTSYGSRAIVPLLGGSGGGGGCGFGLKTGGGGGGGGGAILIASSTTITFASGTISARGGTGSQNISCGQGAGGGGGSGGAIRLVANTIAGTAILNATGGLSGAQGGAGGIGYIRAEGFNLTTFNPVNAVVSTGLPTSVTPANLPTLQIASVAGVAAPAIPAGSFQGTPDVVLPATQPNPVAVVINATNIPVGTSVNLTATTATGSTTTATATLAGATSASSGTANITLSAGLSVLTATTIIDLAQTGALRPLLINGEKVEKIEVAATYGGGSELTYITQSGRRVHSLR
jgi:hypothetical protein